MMYGKSSENTKTFAKIVWLKKWDENLYFSIMKGKDEVAQADYIEWYVTDIELSSYEYEEWKMRDVFNITLIWDEVVTLWCAFNKLGRNILNTLAGGFDADEKIKFSLYKKSWKDGKMYPQIWIRQGSNMLKRKHDWETQRDLTRAVKDPETDEFIRTDYRKLDELMKLEVDNIKAIANTSSKKSTKVEAISPINDDDDSLPF